MMVKVCVSCVFARKEPKQRGHVFSAVYVRCWDAAARCCSRRNDDDRDRNLIDVVDSFDLSIGDDGPYRDLASSISVHVSNVGTYIFSTASTFDTTPAPPVCTHIVLGSMFCTGTCRSLPRLHAVVYVHRISIYEHIKTGLHFSFSSPCREGLGRCSKLRVSPCSTPMLA